MKTAPKPRIGHYFGMAIHNSEFPDGTWLEGEEFAYPNGGFTRRVYARCEDGLNRVFNCSIPDTWFSIPSRGKINGKRVKGFVTTDEETKGMKFIETKK